MTLSGDGGIAKTELNKGANLAMPETVESPEPTAGITGLLKLRKLKFLPKFGFLGKLF